MSESYTKLFNSIVTSTIVSEPVATRWLWVTMLAECDANGCVWASVPGLARVANLTIDEVEAGLKCFLSPDPYSRTKDNDGRRIEEVDGGWRLLNHAKYRAKLSYEERKDYKREWDREHRAKKSSVNEPEQSDNFRQHPTASDSIRQNPTNPTHTDTDTDTDTEAKAVEQDQKHIRAARADASEPKNSNSRAKKADYDPIMHLVTLGVPEQVAQDWQKVRKIKRSPLTHTSVMGAYRESLKTGLGFAEAISICCERGWVGFKAEWITNSASQHHQPRAGPLSRNFIHINRQQALEESNQRIAEEWVRKHEQQDVIDGEILNEA